ncbi:hypothetical protein ACQEVS_00100 [Streptomyces sp. CA-181903]|uniref:hypothetical protein n=1 Tax=Streptomyces sp. CA-181903 TaxID=3240055 RepID=UPI003D8C4CCE
MQATTSAATGQAFAGTSTAQQSVRGGSWVSHYDGAAAHDASALDMDRVVQLAENWDSGASQWTAKERQEYANDELACRSSLGRERDVKENGGGV